MRELDILRQRFSGHTPQLMEARHSYAVLCPLVVRPDGLHLLFEVRSAALRRQPGEVCFPGGQQEAGETAVACALRETWEELHLPPSEIDVLGTPDFLCSARGFLLQPVLGAVSAAGLAQLTPSPDEVGSVFTVPLSFFRTQPPELYCYELRPTKPEGFPYDAVGISQDYAWVHGQVEVPVWFWEGHAIWGMTARIIRNVLELAGTEFFG